LASFLFPVILAGNLSIHELLEAAVQEIFQGPPIIPEELLPVENLTIVDHRLADLLKAMVLQSCHDRPGPLVGELAVPDDIQRVPELEEPLFRCFL